MWNNQKQQKMFSLMSNLQTYYNFKLDFQINKSIKNYNTTKWYNTKQTNLCAHFMEYTAYNIPLCQHEGLFFEHS